MAADSAVTSGGTANAATVLGLKNQLIAENLANIAAQDSRLAMAVNGSATEGKNFSIGTGTAAEADRLGQIWVGDGAKLVGDQVNCPGCLKSADGTRLYRPPTEKPNTPSQYNPTGVQANFQILSIDPLSGKSVTISNGHLSIYK